MIEVLGWLSTVLVLTGYIFNARGLDKSAMVLWIVGDVLLALLSYILI